MSADRVEVQVLERARARALVSDEQLATAQAAHEAALAQGQASNLLVHLANRLDPATRAGVRQIYLEAVEAAREGASVQTTAFDSVQTLPLAPVAETQAEASLPTAATSAGPLAIPGYTLGPELGRGGMGVVYRATSSAGQAVAIKVLLASEGASTEDLARFRTEAEPWSACLPPRGVLLEHGRSRPGTLHGARSSSTARTSKARLDRENAPRGGGGHRDRARGRAELRPRAGDPAPRPQAARTCSSTARGCQAPRTSVWPAPRRRRAVVLPDPVRDAVGDARLRLSEADGDRRRIDERTDVYGLGATLTTCSPRSGGRCRRRPCPRCS
ncbi:MAG: hypothetical protein R3F62_02095 [Planctomycetota bacterium]